MDLNLKNSIRFNTYRCSFQVLVIFNTTKQQGTPPSCDDVVHLKAFYLQCEHCLQFVIIHLHSKHPLTWLNLNNSHELFNIHVIPPKNQIMEEIRNIEHIRNNHYMQLCFSQNFIEGLFHYFKNIFHN